MKFDLKKYLPIIILVLILLAIPLTLILTQKPQEIRPKAAPASNLSFDVASKIVAPNQQFTVNAMLNTGVNTVAGVELHVTYQPAYLRLDSIVLPTINPMLPKLMSSNINPATGQAEIIMLSDVTASNGGKVTCTTTAGCPIATLTFTPLTVTTPTSAVSFNQLTTKIAGASGEDIGKQVLQNVSDLTVTVTNTALNPVSWSTEDVSLQADDFYIIADGIKYLGNVSNVHLNSVPQTSINPNYTTLEVIWNENNREMRLFLYFYKDNNNWWSDEIRTYNGQINGNWIYYTQGKPYFQTPINQIFSANMVLVSDPTNAYSGSIYFKNLRLKAFNRVFPTPLPLPITRVDIHPADINTVVGQQTGMSTLAYNGTTPIKTGITYEWGISSINSIGTISSNNDLATFIAKNAGTGDLWVKATNELGSLTKSIHVAVWAPIPSPSPSPEPTPASVSVNLKFALQGIVVNPLLIPGRVINMDVTITQGTLVIDKPGLRAVYVKNEVLSFVGPNNEQFSLDHAIFALQSDISDVRLNPSVATTIRVKGPMHLSRVITQTLNRGLNIVDFTSVAPKVFLAGDIVNNNNLDIFDFNKFVEDFGPNMPIGGSPADMDMDGDVDVFDFNYIPNNFNKIGE